MKYVLVLLVVMFAIGLWQHNRRQVHRDDQARRTPPPPPPPSPSVAIAPQEMVVCAHCGVHLPVGDAVNGTLRGVYYCGAEHRLRAEAGK
ncbi:MAG: hypothetical protein RLZZ612_159 [Pseudomonadota bacterium]|jgi:uncharacterized protein